MEQVCKCTRAAFWRAGVQEAFVGLRQTQQREKDERTFLRWEKNEPFLFVGGMIRPDRDSGWFEGNILALDSLIQKRGIRAIFELLSDEN